MSGFNDLVERYQQENGRPVPNLCKAIGTLPNEVFRIIGNSWMYSIDHRGDLLYHTTNNHLKQRCEDINTLQSIIDDNSIVKLADTPSNTALATLHILRRDFNVRWLGRNADNGIVGLGNKTPEYRGGEWYGVPVIKFEIYPVWMQELMDWNGSIVDTATIICRHWARCNTIDGLIKEIEFCDFK